MIMTSVGQRFYKLPGMNESKRFVPTNPHTFLLVELIADRLRNHTPERWIYNGGVGFDITCVYTANVLGIPIMAAMSHVGQIKTINAENRKNVETFLERAAEVQYVCGPYMRDRAERHLEWIIERSDCLLAFWDGTAGPTQDAVHKAYAKRTAVDNLWGDFVMHAAEKQI